MSGLGFMDGRVLDRFEELCSAVSSRGHGLTLSEIGDAAALAREMEAETPGAGRVDELYRARDRRSR